MSSSNIKILSLICKPKDKGGQGGYKLALGKNSTDTFYWLSLKSCTFRNIQYNVQSSGPRKNNFFYFNLDGGEEKVNVPEGFYSIYELIDVVKTGIETILAASGIIPLPTLTSLDYNPISAKVSIVINGNGSATPFELLGGTYSASINSLLGNTIDNSLDTLAAVKYTFDSIVNLQHDDRIHLVSSSMAQSIGLTSTGRNGRTIALLRAIPVDKPFGEIVTYESSDIDGERVYFPNGLNLSTVDIALQDTDGNVLDLGNTVMTVEIIAWRHKQMIL